MRVHRLVPLVAGIVAVTAVALAAGPTYSAFTDAANLVVGADGIGSKEVFGLVTIGPDGVARKAPDSTPAVVPVSGEDSFVPGRTVQLDVSVANNTPSFAAAVSVAVSPTDSGGTGQVGTAPNITPLLLVTVVDTTTGQLLIGGNASDPSQGVPVAQASATIGRLAPRQAAPLADGATWVPGASGSREDLTVYLYYPDTPETSTFNGGKTALAVKFYGASTS